MIRVRKIQIPVLPTKEPRRLYIYLPAGYKRSGQRYPVLYMFDGHNVFYNSHATYGKSWGMREYLMRTQLPLIIVGIECNPEGDRRMNEYSPWDLDLPEEGHLEGLGKVTMDWITGSLKPEIDREFRTLPERENTFVAGSSMGGLMALYAVTAYNDVFSGAAALSPCFWAGKEQLHSLLSDTPFEFPTRVYMDYGTAEFDPECREPIAEVFRGAAELSMAGADAAAWAVPGAEHCEACWEKRIPLFMEFLLRDEF